MQIYILTNRIKETKYQQRFVSSSEYRNGSFTLDVSYIFACSAAAHFCMFRGCTFLHVLWLRVFAHSCFLQMHKYRRRRTQNRAGFLDLRSSVLPSPYFSVLLLLIGLIALLRNVEQRH